MLDDSDGSISDDQRFAGCERPYSQQTERRYKVDVFGVVDREHTVDRSRPSELNPLGLAWGHARPRRVR